MRRRTIKTLQYFSLHALIFVNAHDITHSQNGSS